MNFRAGFIAVVGSPNVGKSTLINEMLGVKLLATSNKPQTTRHIINAIDTKDSYQMVFVDTPGIHINNKKAINSYMNKSASSVFSYVDIVVWLIEACKWSKEEDRVLEHIEKAKVPVIICLNKIDKIKDSEEILKFLEKISNKFDKAKEIFPLSAFKKNQVLKIQSLILKYLPKREIIFDKEWITDRSQKFVIAEFIREKLIRSLKNEIPYEITVIIEKFVLHKNTFHITALILVEKDSQKKIVIGNKGSFLKKIGKEARISIEAFLDKKVFLSLWVKVDKNWSRNKNNLSHYGYDNN